VNGFESSLSPTDGFRLNPDGTLTPLPNRLSRSLDFWRSVTVSLWLPVRM
jgi:hypothetical protein